MQANRTFLFAPGNHPRKVEKVFDAGSDVVILDLEDAVAVSEKAATRPVVVDALQRPRHCRGYVRINALDTDFAFGDIDAVVQPGVDGIVLPKVERAADIQMVDWMMTSLERQRGLKIDGIDLMPIIETGKGVANARDICGAGCNRMQRVSFGAGDYTRDMAIEWTFGEGELAHARAEIVLASRINDLEPPIDTVFIHLREHEHLRNTTLLARQFGFQGKMCIHPAQVEPVNDIFTPSDDEIAWSRKVIAAFQEAEAAGSASIQVEGYFVDYPIVVKAERTVALAEAIATANNNG
ncbi:MAG: HpcH/HpaI aldolase/citrate lyase family protein [Hyphomicrobiaceae bacterium]